MSPPLEGIRIADFTQALQGPWATQKLGDMGADVVKVEPTSGSWSRDLVPGGDDTITGESSYWLAANRNKRSIALDLKTDRGLTVAERLVEDADVLVENFRPGVMARLGLGYDDVSADNPDVVYVSASGFGSDGPYAERPGQDLLLQGLTGIADATGRTEDPPTPVPFAVVDEHSAMQIVSYTLTALFHRERTGEGQKVEISLLDAAIDTQCQGLTIELNSDREYTRSEEGIGQKYLGAPYGIYETRDGHVVISMTPIPELADVLDLPELAVVDSGRDAFDRRDEIKRRIEARTVEMETEAVLDRLIDADLWAAEVKTLREAAGDPQVEHNGMIVEIEHPRDGTFRTTGIPGSFSETPGEIRRRPPRVGEHTRTILAELGYDDDRIDRLVADAVAADDRTPS